MNAAEYIASGIIDSYCMGFTSRDENLEVEEMAALFTEVQLEIEKTKASLSSCLLNPKMQPSTSIKTVVMHTIYTQQAELHKKFVPLMHKQSDFDRYYQSAAANHLMQVNEPFDNLYAIELPSTKEVINLAVWAKQGHEEEVHSGMIEYIAILEVSCDMYMMDKKISYTKGEIISIPPGIPHHAVITSQQPMFALVQRQIF